MHILLTNDDGPPDPHASPYIREFVRVLRAFPFNHTVSVVIPSQQRSWIGKAHLLPAAPNKAPLKPAQKVESQSASSSGKSKNEDTDDLVKPVYYDPASGAISQNLPNEDGNSGSTNDYWVLVPGTPAACSQLGLFHHQTLFPARASHRSGEASRATLPDPSSASIASTRESPVDLVISGPNHGRNTTAAFALSSGTLGGALEAAICGVKAIAISFAFFTRQESEEMITQACVHSAKIVERLFKEWPSDPASGQSDHDQPDLFSVNVPLVEGVAERPTKWTWMLNNKWMAGSLYRLSDRDSENPQQKEEEEEEEEAAAAASRPMFKWAPNFSDVWKSVEESAPGNDGHTIRQSCSSVTPLKANYHGLYGTRGYEGELKL